MVVNRVTASPVVKCGHGSLPFVRTLVNFLHFPEERGFGVFCPRQKGRGGALPWLGTHKDKRRAARQWRTHKMALISPASLCLFLPLTMSRQVLADDLTHNRSTLLLDIIPDIQNGTSGGKQQNTTDGIHYTVLTDNKTGENIGNEISLTLRKCCSNDHYYDSRNKCVKRTSGMPDNIILANDFLSNASHKSVNTLDAGKFVCQENHRKTSYHSNETFLDGSGQLCDYNGNCYANSSYCIEHKSDEDNAVPRSMAYGCRVYHFRKCCPQDQLFSDTGCVDDSNANISDSMTELQERLPSRIGFPLIDGKPCELISLGVKDTDPRWLIDSYGFLKRFQWTYSTERYCVDDQLYNNITPQLVAHICSSEINEMEIQDKIAKCCSEDEYFLESEYRCKETTEEENILTFPQIRSLTYAQEVVSDYIPPCCSNCYFTNFLDKENPIYGVLLNDGNLESRIRESGRVVNKFLYNRKEFCVDYTIGENGTKRLWALLCINPSDEDETDSDAVEFALTSTLLGLSCIGLFITSISIITRRVRRGAVNVYMVNTLTGKILLSYVVSTMLAFLVLIINKQMTFIRSSNGCLTIAGFQLFFLLSSFFWNSSICLEMLFLTLGVRVPEWGRYLGHCLWALGIPGIITTLAFVLDSYRDELPNAIVPLFGINRCNFSEKTAELLYQYIPIMITVLVNLGSVVAARYIRSVRLQQLEKSGKSEDTDASKEGTTKQKSSGMRTHQAQSTWKESLKLGMWSGSTWLVEVFVSVIFSFWVEASGRWFEYFTYLPVIINCLRGVGVCYILVFTQENRIKWSKHLLKLSSQSRINRPLARISYLISPKRKSSEDATTSVATATTSM